MNGASGLPVVVVTGGAGSIGTAVGQRLARTGYTVCVADITDRVAREAAARLPGDHHLAFGGDLSDEATVARLVDYTASHGRVQGLVNGVGVSPKSAQGKLEIGEIDSASFLEVLRVNTVGPFLVAKHLFPLLRADGSGSIVNILSIAARLATGGRRGARFPPFISSASHYAASKAALQNLQISMCREFAPDVRVNGVAPGYIRTAMNRNVAESELESVAAQIPLARMGRPEDVAGAVSFLLGPDSAYISGAVIDVNGGWLPA